MTERVIDLLELVEIDMQDADFLSVLVHGRELFGQKRVELHAVRQAGQHVGLRALLQVVAGALQRFLTLDLLGHIPGDDDDLLLAAVFVIDNGEAELVPEILAVLADVPDNLEPVEDTRFEIVPEVLDLLGCQPVFGRHQNFRAGTGRQSPRRCNRSCADRRDWSTR